MEVFSLERVLKKSSVFDFKKLEWLNGQHLAATPTEDLLEPVKGGWTEKGLLGPRPEPTSDRGSEAQPLTCPSWWIS